jgi:hypothetical protein
METPMSRLMVAILIFEVVRFDFHFKDFGV